MENLTSGNQARLMKTTVQSISERTELVLFFLVSSTNEIYVSCVFQSYPHLDCPMEHILPDFAILQPDLPIASSHHEMIMGRGSRILPNLHHSNVQGLLDLEAPKKSLIYACFNCEMNIDHQFISSQYHNY